MKERYLEEVVSLAQELVRIPSENPTGSERAMADRVARYGRELGVEVFREEVEPGRENVILALGEGKSTLAFVCHMDTVPMGEGWSREPFAGTIEGEKLFGRGAADLKGGFAACLVAFRYLTERASRGESFKRRVLLCGTVDEEGALMRGANALVDNGWIDGESFVLASEPTSLELVVAAKGVMWYEISVRGRSAHASVPHTGADAIYAMILALSELKDRVAALEHEHPLLGKATLTTSVIEGGTKTNVVPGLCRAEVDLRFPPPLSCAGALELITESARRGSARIAGTLAEVRTLSLERPPVVADEKSPLAGAFRKAREEVSGKPLKVKGVPYYTDAGMIAVRTGNPHCLVFGPGNIDHAHGPDEFVELGELREGLKLIARAAELVVHEGTAPPDL